MSNISSMHYRVLYGLPIEPKFGPLGSVIGSWVIRFSLEDQMTLRTLKFIFSFKKSNNRGRHCRTNFP